jgi:hypothetical protein
MKPIEVSSCFVYYLTFCANFEPVEIYRIRKNLFYICKQGTKDVLTEYLDCGSGDYVDGWLNGAIKTLYQLKRKDKDVYRLC